MSFQTGVLNFALFTKLPLPPSPHTSLSVLAVTTAFASAAGHAPRPSPLRASGVSLKLRDIATRRHLPTRTPRTAVDAPRRRTRRAVPCAASQLAAKPLPCPSSATTQRPDSISLVPCISQACPPSLPGRAEAPPHHGRRLHLGRRRASSCAPPLPKPTL